MQFASWLNAIPTSDAISLYVHIPFCRRLCWFCACRTQGVKTDTPLETYVRRLETEIDMVFRNLPQGVTLSTITLGWRHQQF